MKPDVKGLGLTLLFMAGLVAVLVLVARKGLIAGLMVVLVVVVLLFVVTGLAFLFRRRKDNGEDV